MGARLFSCIILLKERINCRSGNLKRRSETWLIIDKGTVNNEETTWGDFRKTLNLTPEEENAIELEKSLIRAVVKVREQNGLTQKQLSELRGVRQPILIAVLILFLLDIVIRILKFGKTPLINS